MSALRRAEDDEAPLEPNFEIGPTFEEELAQRKLAEEQQEVGVMQFIAEMNVPPDASSIRRTLGVMRSDLLRARITGAVGACERPASTWSSGA